MTKDRGFIRSFKNSLSRQNTSPTTKGYQSRDIFDFNSLRHLTAVFVDDLEPKKDYDASTARHVGRIGVTSATLVAFAAMATFLFMSAVPTSPTVRHYGSHKDSQDQSVFDFVASDAGQFSNKTNHICFCRRTNINWPDYVAFFPLSMRSGNLSRLSYITDGQGFCENTILDPGSRERDNSMSFNACLIMVDAVVGSNLSQTCLESASLIGPSLLNDTIASRVTGGLDQIWWNYVRILSSLNDTQRDYTKITKLHTLWTSMVGQFNTNHTSSDQDYWDAANRSGTLNVIDGNETALGMEVSWYKYANLCNPPFCDIVKQNSWLYRAFLVVAQLGGLSTLALLFVRVFLWPLLRHLFGWPLVCGPDPAQDSSIQLNPSKRNPSFSQKINPVEQNVEEKKPHPLHQDVVKVSANKPQLVELKNEISG